MVMEEKSRGIVRIEYDPEVAEPLRLDPEIEKLLGWTVGKEVVLDSHDAPPSGVSGPDKNTLPSILWQR